MTVALDQIPTTLNDHTVAGDTPAGRMLASVVWAQVFRVGPGLTPQLDTNVVDSAEVVSLQPQTVVYQIDPRAVWSDGVPVTVADFSYAWDSQKGGATDIDGTPDSVASTLGYRDIASLTGSNDGRTVTVVFHTPFADWSSLFDDLLPAHIAEAVGWNHGFDHFAAGVFVSGGPFEVQSWQPGSEIVLTRNPRWWGSPPSLDKIVVRAVSGDAELTSALAQGHVQVAYPAAFDQSFMAQASSSSVLQTQVGLGTSMLQLEFNVRRAPVNVTAVRQGIAHAIDRAGIVEQVGQPEDHSVWEDNHHLFANGEPGYADDATGYENADPVVSARLLEQSGFATDGDGSWTLHGKPVTLNLV
ncbi:MAG TPA: ABC transporter substrate-binding protein, partial [Acidimicrobiales bacterium]|nr:ABC transporter substrate-binding protein [Acidimicrobiales bacterium]